MNPNALNANETELTVDFEALASTSGDWLCGSGPEADIVISSRIRLARNIARYPFLSRADGSAREEIANTLREHLGEVTIGGSLEYVDVEELGLLDRQLLMERQIISRELAEAHGARGVAIGSQETLSVMVNEEDHLRMQSIRSGFDLEHCWERVDKLDDQVEEEVTYAFSDKLGYLTACPTNVGTGIRVSVMLHLPGLVFTKEVQKVYQALQKISLAVRGLYGEGSQATGDFYQISNQITLGQSEAVLLEKIREVVENIIGYERRVRDALVKQDRAKLNDRVSRSLGTLRSAHQITSEETLSHLSNVRLGVNMGLIDEVGINTVNDLFMQTQPAHLQKIQGEELNKDERDAARATHLRQHLGTPDQ